MSFIIPKHVPELKLFEKYDQLSLEDSYYQHIRKINTRFSICYSKLSLELTNLSSQGRISNYVLC